MTISKPPFVQLKELCKPKQWKSLKQSEMTDSGYPVYGANGQIGWYSSYNHVHPTIVVGCRGTCGQVNVCEPKSYVTSNGMCLDDLSPEVDMDYLVCFLKGYDFTPIIGGSSQPQITKRGIGSILIPLPGIERQLYISKRFMAILQLMDSLDTEIAKLDSLVKSRFVEMFGEYSSNPDGQLQDVSEFVTVGIANAATHAYADSGVVMLRNLNVRENHLDDTDLVHIKPDFASKYRKKKLKANDILVTRTGYPGIACVVPAKYEGCQTFTTLIVRLKENAPVTALYISQLINSPLGKEYVRKMKAGSSQQNFGATSLKHMPIGIPPLALQSEFADFASRVDKLRVDVQRQKEKLQMLYDSLAQEYFG